ncbi:MAG TPA: group 1 truncated hemoglobin [Phycisphaerae bacterium]|jgi:hemoglobin|nr:group 1 truncated hemoglobin [Phycisphaerae bacterium]
MLPLLRIPLFRAAALAVTLGLFVSCGSTRKTDNSFFTSGSQQADQRAEQRMAKSNQLQGSNKKPDGSSAPATPTLYARLGGNDGITAIVNDFVPRAIADPRVNWVRSGITYGGFLGIHRKSAAWDPSPANQAQLKHHMVQFIAVATGGPSKYDGRDMKDAHAGMKITNTEFDAAIGDLKASLDKLGIATGDQKELLAIIESTRPQIVTVR